MRTRDPTRTSFSTEAPRPTTDSAPISLRSRTCAWSATTERSPIRAPATTTAPAPTVAPTPISAGPSAPPAAAVELAWSVTGLPTTHPSWSRAPAPTRTPAWTITCPPMSTSSGSSTPSPSSSAGARSEGRSSAARDNRRLRQRTLQPLQATHDPQRGRGARARLGPVLDAVEKMPALDPQRLLVRHPRREDVTRARDVLAVRGIVLVEALVVHGELPLELHIVEGRHPLRADDREAALLVRVEPGQVHVGDQPRLEAHQREHNVLHARLHVALADGGPVVGLLAREHEDHREVVGAEGPERVLVLAMLAEVEAVRVDVAQRAQFAGAHQRGQPFDARVVLEQMAHHEHAFRRARSLDDGLGLLLGLGKRLLHEAVLPRLECLDGEHGVGRHGRGDHQRVERVVAEQLLQPSRRPRRREGAPPTLERLLRGVAQPRELGTREPVEVPGEVRPPVAEAGDPDGRHRRTRFGASIPRVTPRKSTTSGASRTTRSRSRPGCAVTITATSMSSGHSERSPCSGSSGTNSSW